MKRTVLTAAIATLLIAAASPAFAVQIFVSNEKDNTVTVLDGETLKIVKTIPTARRPRGIIASPDHREIYVPLAAMVTSSTSSTWPSSRSSASSTPAPTPS